MVPGWRLLQHTVWDIRETLRKHRCVVPQFPRFLGCPPSYFYLLVFLCLFVMLCPGYFSCKRENLEGMGLLSSGQNALSFIKWKKLLCALLLHVNIRDNWTNDIEY